MDGGCADNHKVTASESESLPHFLEYQMVGNGPSPWQWLPGGEREGGIRERRMGDGEEGGEG